MADVLRLMDYVNQQGEQGRQRGEQSRLGMLAGQSYTATPDQQPGILSQMARLNPEMAQQQQGQFQQQDDRTKSKAAAAAQYVLNAQKTGDANAVRGAYATVRPFLEELGRPQGKIPPPEWSDDMLPMLHQVVSAGGGAGTQNEMKNVRIGEDGYYWAVQGGQMVNTGVKAAPQNQIIDTGNGFFGVNNRNLQAAPVQVGGAPPQQAPQAPQPGMYQTPQGIVRLGDDLSPEQREAAMADAATGGTAQNVSLPARNASPQQYGGGQQLRSAPKPQAPSELERRVEMARNMGASPEQIQALVMGNASTKGPSAAEQKDALARRAKQPQVANAVRGLGRIENAVKALSSGMVNTGPLDQYATRYTKAGQELEAAVGGIQNSLLSLTRVPGIGSQSDLEARIANMQYPSLDKDPEVNARTVENLKAFIADLQEAYQLADAPVAGNGDKKGGSDIDSLLDLYK